MTEMKNNSTEILNELKEISPFLATMEKVNVFQVPQNYFSQLNEKILTELFIRRQEKNNVQKVPDGYFDSLSDRIISKIKTENIGSASEEIQELSPALNYLREEAVFTIPENYFDDLSDRILDKIHSEKANVISISFAKKWWKYAAAAVIIGIIAISSLLTFNNKNKKEIASKNIPAYIKEASKYPTPEKLNEGISSLSKDDIVNYLQSNGNILDEEVITKDLDTKDLPATEDYLVNENTLNNFLEKLNSEGNKNIQ